VAGGAALAPGATQATVAVAPGNRVAQPLVQSTRDGKLFIRDRNGERVEIDPPPLEPRPGRGCSAAGTDGNRQRTNGSGAGVDRATV